jgi:hypothetical protein
MIMRWPFQSYQATYAIAALVIVGGILVSVRGLDQVVWSPAA